MNPLKFDLDERPIPDAALRDKDARELLRVWVAENGLHCSLLVSCDRSGLSIIEESAWGVILATAVRHLAVTLRREGDEAESLVVRIRDALNEELASPIDMPPRSVPTLH